MGVGDDIPIAGGDDARTGAVGGLAGARGGDGHGGLHHLVVDLLGVQGLPFRLLVDGDALLVGGHVHVGQLNLRRLGGVLALLGAVRLAFLGQRLHQRAPLLGPGHRPADDKPGKTQNHPDGQGGGNPQKDLQPPGHFLPGRLGRLPGGLAVPGLARLGLVPALGIGVVPTRGRRRGVRSLGRRAVIPPLPRLGRVGLPSRRGP